MKKKNLSFRTRSIHVGSDRDPQTGAVVPPIHVASTYVLPGAGEPSEFDYARTGNPSRQRLEQLVASLEGGVGGLAYSSGMAATHGAMMLLKQGDHVIAGADIYGGTYRLLHKVLNQAGIEVSLVDTRQIDRLDRAVCDNTRMLWLGPSQAMLCWRKAVGRQPDSGELHGRQLCGRAAQRSQSSGQCVGVAVRVRSAVIGRDSEHVL